MRILRLLVDEHHRIELHPGLTVVTGLTDGQRSTVRRAFTAAATGLAPATCGLIEAQGVLFDLDQASLDLLEVADDPSAAVLSMAGVDGAIAEPDAARLREAERDVLVLAADRHRAALAMAAAEQLAAGAGAATGPTSPPTELVAQARRAQLLRRALGLHRATDAEPVRAALDRRRDARQVAAVGGPRETLDGELRSALAGVGIDVRELDLAEEEVVRIAEDWLDERQRDVAWAVGASVELHGLETVLERNRCDALDTELAADPVLEASRRRIAAERAARTHADAIARADALASDLGRNRTTATKDLEWHLLSCLAEHRRDRLAGSVPLVVDGLPGGVGDQDLGPLLDRVAQMAGSVQVVLLADDPRVEAWARAANERRVAVVSPTRDETGGIWS